MTRPRQAALSILIVATYASQSLAEPTGPCAACQAVTSSIAVVEATRAEANTAATEAVARLYAAQASLVAEQITLTSLLAVPEADQDQAWQSALTATVWLISYYAGEILAAAQEAQQHQATIELCDATLDNLCNRLETCADPDCG